MKWSQTTKIISFTSNCINNQVKYMITCDQNGSCWCCVDTRVLRGITRALLKRINAVALGQISMHGLELVWSGPSAVPIGNLSSCILMSVWIHYNLMVTNQQEIFNRKLVHCQFHVRSQVFQYFVKFDLSLEETLTTGIMQHLVLC